MNTNFDLNNNQEKNELELKDILHKYLIHWKWILISVIFSIICSYLYLKFVTPIYKASTTILIKNEDNGSMLSKLNSLSGGTVGGSKNKVDDEIEFLKSRKLVEKTVRKLNYNVLIYKKEKFTDVELYKENIPIEPVFLQKSSNFDENTIIFTIIPIDEEKFQINNTYSDGLNNVLETKFQTSSFSQPIKTKYGTIKIAKTGLKKDLLKKGNTLFVKVFPIDNVIDQYKSNLIIIPSKNSSAIEISMKSPILEKAQDFLDYFVQMYNNEAVDDKNLITEKTSEFIFNRLKIITQELGGVEQDVESFKKLNKLTDIESEAKLFVDGASEYNKKEIEIDIQMGVAASMLDFVKTNNNLELLPSGIIPSQGAGGEASSVIANYNKLILDRNRVLKSATIDNPVIIKMDEQIVALKANIISSLNRMQSTLAIQKRNLNDNKKEFDSKIRKIPEQEREFRVIARQQKVKEALYLFLLQKREETALTLASTEPNARVIDKASGIKTPVYPNKNVFYLGAFLLGIFVPVGIIYILELLDTKITSKLDIEHNSKIPFIGDVPKSENPKEIIRSEDRSPSAEALRIIRTNLEFMVTKVQKDKAKVFFITSTFPGEGKTFIATNLASTFAMSDKKVLLIGMDIRNPKLHEFTTLSDVGFTNYIHSNDLKWQDLIIKQKNFNNFYILPAGIIPPNPAELLMDKKVELFFEEVKNNFDYIVVDTAPMAPVTDTLLVANNADCFVYVVRSKKLEKKMLYLANGFYRDKKLPNMCILLNDANYKKGYGYSYGYEANVEKKVSWHKKIIKK